MRSYPQSSNAPPTPPPLDLSVDSAATRAEVYARVAVILFEPCEDDPGEPLAAAVAAAQAGLEILFLFHRCFAAWALPAEEAAELPPCRRFEMVRVQPDPDAPAGVTLSEV